MERVKGSKSRVMKVFKFVLLPLLLLAALYILFFQPQFLGISLGENSDFPLGTLVSWFIVFLFALFFYVIIPVKNKSIIGKISKVLLALNVWIGVFWGVLSWLLAGNWNFVFTENMAFKTWVILTSVVFVVPVLVLLSLGFSKIAIKKRR